MLCCKKEAAGDVEGISIRIIHSGSTYSAETGDGLVDLEELYSATRSKYELTVVVALERNECTSLSLSYMQK